MSSLKPGLTHNANSLKILMVSTEYPPMNGGVGRYTSNLTRELNKFGLQVQVLSNENGHGDFFGLSPKNTKNYSVLLKIVNEVKPDIVHIQFEHGLYGLKLNSLNPKKSNTNIDLFYDLCKTPIVTTFHTAFNFILHLHGVDDHQVIAYFNLLSGFNQDVEDGTRNKT